MKKREPVAQIMTANVHTVSEKDDLHQAVKTIRMKKIRHLPVVNGAEVVGILSRTDLNRLTFGGLFDNQDGADEAILNMLTIPQVMTAKPTTIDITASIRDVAEIFATSEFHCLPVTEGGKLAGIVTTTDVIRYMLDQY